jgi:glutathione S-transferase
MSSLPTLLHFRVSHYNEKVRWALDYKRIPHRRMALVPGWHIPRVRLLTGQNKIPVLLLKGKPIADSPRILKALEQYQPDPPLYPADPVQCEQALQIQRYFDEEVAPEVRRLFWSTYFSQPDKLALMATMGFKGPIPKLWRIFFWVAGSFFKKNMGADPERIAAAAKRLPSHFDWLEQKLGGREYLVGDSFTVADLTAASVMTALIRPPEFPYPLPQPWPEELLTLREKHAHRAGFKWVLAIYARHRGTSSEVP